MRKAGKRPLTPDDWARAALAAIARGGVDAVAVETVAGAMDIRALHERMGRVYHQPVRVHSFTNKRFTVNFRVPLSQLRRGHETGHLEHKIDKASK